MSNEITFAQLYELRGGKSGNVDTICPCCSPDRRSSVNRKRPVLRTWMPDDNFITYKCARCDLSGYAKPDAWLSAPPALSATPSSPSYRPAVDEEQIDEERRLSRADAIWSETISIIRTPGETYLTQRGILLDDVPEDGGLRWHASCPWKDGVIPCIVSRFTDAVTGEPRGIHRRPTTGDKPMSLGPIAGCVIRLWPGEDVAEGLVIGEGVETTLAAATCIEHRGTLLRPAWAAGSKGNLAKFPILAGIEMLTILVDHDESGGGQDAAAKCAQRWRDAGREVIRLMPGNIGFDFNDLVKEQGQCRE
jgi:Toprim domain-containing protein